MGWKEIFQGRWKGKPIAMYENADLDIEIVTPRGKYLSRYFVTEDEVHGLTNLKKHGTNYAILAVGPGQEGELINELERKSIDILRTGAKRLRDVPRSAKFLFSEHLLALPEPEQEKKVLLGESVDGPVMVNCSFLKSVSVTGENKNIAIQVLLENCALCGKDAILFDSGEFKKMRYPRPGLLDGFGMPVQEPSLEVVKIDMAALDARCFANAIGIYEKSDVHKLRLAMKKSSGLPAILEKLESARLKRIVKLAIKRYGDYFGETDPDIFAAPKFGMGTIFRIDCSKLPAEMRSAAICSLAKQINGTYFVPDGDEKIIEYLGKQNFVVGFEAPALIKMRHIEKNEFAVRDVKKSYKIRLRQPLSAF